MSFISNAPLYEPKLIFNSKPNLMLLEIDNDVPQEVELYFDPDSNDYWQKSPEVRAGVQRFRQIDIPDPVAWRSFSLSGQPSPNTYQKFPFQIGTQSIFLQGPLIKTIIFEDRIIILVDTSK